MTLEERLLLISKIGWYFWKLGRIEHEYCSDWQYQRADELDGYWLIGMLCDHTLSDRDLEKHIEEIKSKFPEYAHLFEKIG